MIGDGSTILSAAGRDWNFKITVDQWMRLEKHFNGGPHKINARIFSDEVTIPDVREVIERGLEGGGLAIAEAREAATSIMNSQPFDPSFKLATDILGAAWLGVEEFAKKKAIADDLTSSLSKIARGNGTSPSYSGSDSSPAYSQAKPSGSVSASISPS